MNQNIVSLCKFLGGSHLYGLNTPESDMDYRGVFMHTDPSYILGTKRFDEERMQNHTEQIDIVYKELNKMVALLKDSNSEAIEALFAPEEAFTENTEIWKEFRKHAIHFVDSEKLYKCLAGYMQGEYRLAIGERKGKIGGKRYSKLQEVGYSPKNFTQLFRLAYLGRTFFLEDRFVVNVKKDATTDTFDFLMGVKTKPENFTKEKLTELFHAEDAKLKEAFEARKYTFRFDEKLANELLLAAYLPYLLK
jgi:hypothetical protein